MQAYLWAVIESYLAGFVSSENIHEMKKLDQQARTCGDQVLHLPTHFAWGYA
jgi:hypothetical protein